MNKKNLILAAIIIAIGFSIYAFNLHNSLFWDDDDWIINNLFVHDLSYLKEMFTENVLAGFGLNSNYYRPLLLFSFAINYMIGGLEPFGYHLLSNLFHVGNGVLIFCLLLYVFKRRLPAFIASLLFLIHPLQTEAVTYISGRGDPMSVFFMLLALYFFTKFSISEIKNWRFLALFFMILAVLSRETAILLPALLMVFYISFIAKTEFLTALKESLIRTAPYWLVSIGYFVLRLTVLNFQNTLNFYSGINDYTQHLSYRIYTFGAVLVEYFKLIFMPLGLHMERDVAIRTSVFQWPVWLAVAILVLIIYLGFYFHRRNNTVFRIWLFSWVWFFIGLAPVSGIIPINAVMYEHWLYLSLIGFFTLVGFSLAKLFDYFKNRKFIYGALILVLISYLCFLGIVSVRRNILWGNPIKFYEDILKYNPNTARIINNLANLYSNEGELDKAEELYKRAIENPNGNLFAQPYYNLGNLYRDRGEVDKAIEFYKRSIEVDPSFPFSYQNLAVIYANRGDLVEAADMLEKVKKLKPYDPRVYYNLGLIYLAQNNFKLTVENLKVGLQNAGSDKEVYDEIQKLLTRLGELNN